MKIDESVLFKEFNDKLRNDLADKAVKDNLYNKGYRDGYNAAQKEIADQYVHFMEMNFPKKEETNG